MIDHDDLVTAVAERAGSSSGTARAAVSAVTGAVARHLLNEPRERLATAFPDAARYAATTLGDVESPDGTEVVDEVARRLGTDRADALGLTRAVLAAIEDAEPGLVDLPPGVREALTA